LLDANPNAPPVFGPILDKALAQNPAHRYQTMPQFSSALKDAERDLKKMLASGISWQRQAKARLIVKPGGQEILVSGQSELFVGRASKKSVPDIDLSPFGGSQAGVSRRHSRLVCRQGQWFVEDLGSTNGTFINGEKIAPRQLIAVKHQDLIRCGQIELLLEID
jgi:hypothetical protein